MKTYLLTSHCLLSLGFLLLCQTQNHAAENSKKQPAVSSEVTNRPALPDEWGYHPADGEKIVFNPPSLCWVHDENPANFYRKPLSFDLELASNPEFKDAFRVQGIPWTTYTHNTALPPGTWYWRYCKSGHSEWSQTRSFKVDSNTEAFPCPSREEQKKLVSATHPRLFITPQDLPKLRELAKGEEKVLFAQLLARADQALAVKTLPPEPPFAKNYSGSGPSLNWTAYTTARQVCDTANTLAFVALITGEKKYADGARKWLMDIASWDPVKGQTAFEIYDYPAWAMMTGIARSYDWAYESLTPEERQKVLSNLKTRAEIVWKSRDLGFGGRHIACPFGSHSNISWQRLGELALAIYTEVPDAPLWFDHAVQCFFSSAPVWGDEDGGWHEGLHYYFCYMQDIVRWIEIQKVAIGVDGLKKPFFKHAGDLPLYMASPGSPNAGFGDLNHLLPKAEKPISDSYWPKFMGYFEQALSLREPQSAAHWKWWDEKWHSVNEDEDELSLDFIRRGKLPPMPTAKDPSDLPLSKIFHGTGVASMHTTLLDSSNDVHLAFKSDPMGTMSHGANPQNSFFLNAYGDALLEAISYRDSHFGPFRLQWVCSTKAHNCVLINHEGQKREGFNTFGCLGEIVSNKFTSGFDYVQGEAVGAYEGKLKHFRRHMAFLKPDWIVIYDDIEANAPSTFQWMLHTGVEFKVDEPNKKLSFEREHAGLEGAYLCSGPLAFKQWDKYDPMPKSIAGGIKVADLPNQWHLEASLEAASTQARMITVLVPYKIGAKPTWSATRIENDKAIGVKLKNENGEHMIVFSKDLKGASAELEGVTTDGFIGVK